MCLKTTVGVWDNAGIFNPLPTWDVTELVIQVIFFQVFFFASF